MTDTPSPPTDSGAKDRPPTVRYPARTKAIIVVVLALAIGGFVLAGFSAETEAPETPELSGGPSTAVPSTIANGVELLDPGRGDQVLAQERVRIDLVAGWTGELVLQPSAGEAIPIPADEIEITALDELIFVPGDGKVVERLPNGRLCVRATIWNQARGRSASERVETWCFDVT